MRLKLKEDKPDDFKIANGEKNRVSELKEKTFALKNIHILWKGSGINEIGYDKNTNKEYIFINEKYYRPAEVDLLLGDPTKANTILGWKPKITFDKLVEKMVHHDC